ncbi:MAG: alpha-amylase family glycosyl hydrolase [Bacteroidota bacterium]
MKKILYAILCSSFFFAHFAQAQILTTDPPIPRWCEQFTVIYDATEGNGALVGVVPVYAHTGVITAQDGPGNWQNVVGDWGTNDPDVFMTPLGNNKHSIDIYIPDFYNVDTLQSTVVELAFVFRTGDGSLVGRDSDGSDIFMPVYNCTSTDLIATIVSPGEESFITNLNETIEIQAQASVSSTITLYDNDVQIAQTTGTSLMHNITVSSGGNHVVKMVADNGSQVVEDSFVYVVNPTQVIDNPPAGTEHGINYVDASTVRLQLWAPNKSFMYVIGDFNNWQVNTNYFMKRATDGETWWIEISGLTPGEEYAFQYFVDGEIRTADPYSTKVLDFWNDPALDDDTYPNLKPFPQGASGVVSVLQTDQQPYNWVVDDFDKPENTDLVIYELLMRDFLEAHDYDTLLDTLDYLARLGVNAIEFMPVNEFEGNDSWGYNPSFHMALDKYYGPADQFKAFIDECHQRGIAVIIDVVYNHVFSQSPLAQLYWNSGGFRPAPNNPWLNEYPKHGFNVGYDVNHDSQASREWMDRINRFWIEEYKVDGFRFDLSKGFTQNQTCDDTGGNCDIGSWSAYDAGRVFNLQRMADEIWSYEPDAYLILEHLGDNSEETVLANHGFMLWGKATDQYNQAAMGYSENSDFGYAVNYQFRGWNNPHLVGYMESHDEERLMYKNLNFGNSNGGGYNVTNLSTALDRQELVGAFFFTVPGPKMLWQFGEVGYDYSINHCTDGSISENCRLVPKPIRWDYYDEQDRRDLYNVWSDLIKLRTTFDVFKTTNYSMDVGSLDKRIHLNSNEMDVTVLGNFNVNGNSNFVPNFQHTGWWYEYFTQDSIFVSNTGAPLSLAAGEYRLYTDVRITPEDITTSLTPVNAMADFGLELMPNPASEQTRLVYNLPENGDVKVEIFNALGQRTNLLWSGYQSVGAYELTLMRNDLPSGYYIVRVTINGRSQAKKLILY